ncbi:MAG: Ig-like domain-containing protein [Cyanobacteria bacterium]|nr:Ig-like domain-containing protein [Cyanobacteriota bacterium]
MAQLLLTGSELISGSTLEEALQGVQTRLESWASNTEAYNALLLEVFGVQNSETTGALQASLSGSGLGISLETLDGAALSGINGAYTSAAHDGAQRIYLNNSWLQTATAAEIEAVLLEEIGHFIDHALNGEIDTPGDEGEIFSARLRGLMPARSAFSENDQSLIYLNDTVVAVETASTSTTPLSGANLDFETGLIGWSVNDSVSLVGSASISAGNNIWSISPSGGSMAQLTPIGVGNEFSSSAKNFLGISDTSLNYINATFAGNSGGKQPTNFAAASTTFAANAGDTLNISWNYVSTDYTPWNDGSVISVVNLDAPTSFASIYGYAAEVFILGATNPGTGTYSTGSYGSTGWQTAKIRFLTTGAYKLGISTFNLGDTLYSPYLFIDDLKGITLQNGTPFAPIGSDPTPPPPSGTPVVITDTTPPDAPSITAVTDNFGSVTGIVASDGSTDDTTLVIAGTAEANSSVTVYNGSTSLGTASTNNSGLWSFNTSTLIEGNTYSFNATATDADGNVSGDSDNYTVTVDAVDTLAPTVAISDDNSGTAKIGQDVTFTFTFSEAVSGFTAADITVGNGAKGAFTAVSSSIYTLDVTPPAASTGNVTIDVAANAATDAAGNGNTAPAQYTQAFNTVAPTITISDDNSGTAKIGQDVTFTFNFSEAVSDFSTNGITVGNGTKGTFTAVSSSFYTLVVTPTAASSGNVTIDVAASAANNAAGNGNTAPAQYTQAFDTAAPTITISDDNSGTAKIGQNVTFTFTFSEAVSGFSDAAIAVGNGTMGTFTAVSSSVYTLVVTPKASSTGNVTIDVAANAASDAVGNGNTAPAQYIQAFDTVAPTVIISDNNKSVDKVGQDVLLTFTFSEAVSGFSTEGINVGNATKGTFTKVSSFVYTLVLTPQAPSPGDATIDVTAGAAFDAAGNGNVAPARYIIDTKPPEITSIITEGNTVTLKFSELVNATAVPSSAFVVETLSSANVVTTYAINTIALNPSDNSRVVLTLAITPTTPLPPSTSNLRVSYTDPAGNQITGVIEDLTGNDAPSWTNRFADTFISSSTATLASQYLNLQLSGSSAINGTGNSLDNIISGNSGKNIINGGAGNDILTGGAGADTFRLDTALNGSTNVDLIMDFTPTTSISTSDRFELENAIFTGLTAPGKLATALFVSGSSFTNTTQRIRYELSTVSPSKMFYDADGSGTANSEILFAMFKPGQIVSNAGFVVT